MKSKSTAVNKITRPTLPKVFPRTRLFRRLDQARRFPVTWISGPPGSGKTTLVASYLDQRKLPCLWYRVDEGDADLATFFYYLGLAGQKANPRSKKPLPLLTPEYQFGIPTFTRRYFETLYQRLKPPYVIIFDNYQTIPAEALFHEIIRNGFSETPRGIQVIIISRGDPAQAFTRLRANNLLHTLDWEELRLTPPELKGMVKLHDKKPVSQNTLQHLLEKTQGWTAGVVLLEKIREQAAGPSILNGRIPEAIFDYFAGEVFDRIDPEMQTFLLKSAYLPRMTPLMAEQLTGNHHAGRILAELNRKNYFVEKRAQPELTYQFHALFREFLRKRAEQEFSADIRIRLQYNAAKVLESSNQIEDAIELFIEIRDWKALAGLVLVHAPDMLKQGRHHLLQKWLESLPPDILDANPWLFYWKGVCRLPYNLAESRSNFEKAFQLFEIQKDDTGAFSAWSGVVQTFLLEFNDYKPLDRWIAWLHERSRQNISFPSPALEASVATGMTGALVWRMPSHPGITAWVNRALYPANRTMNIDECLRVYSNSAIYYIWMGEFERCGMLIDEMMKIVQTQITSPLRRIILKIIEAMRYNSSTEFTGKGIEAVSEGLNIAMENGVHVMDPLLFVHGICGSMNQGDLEKAREYLSRMEKVVREESHTLSSLYSYLSAWHSVLSGDLPRAIVSAEKSLLLIEEAGVPVFDVLIRLVLAHALHETGACREAQAHLDVAKKNASAMSSHYFSYMAHLTDAYFIFAQKDCSSGMEALRTAMALGRQNNFTTMVYFWRPAVFSRLCAAAIAAGIEVEYAKHLVRKLSLVPETPPMYIESWPWPVKIYTLGKFEVVLDDRPIKFSKKIPKKLMEALKILIAAGNKGIGLPQLADTLWPQADGDLANQSLVKTLNRLRHLIGHKEIFLASEGHLALNPQCCWVDAWAFEQMLVEAEQGKQNRESDRLASGLLEKALSLYEGLFLPDDLGQPWADAKRERLRNKFIRSLEKMGLHWEQSGDPEKAVTYYLQGLETDDLAEEFYRHLMTAYEQMGRRAEAIRIYQRCEKTFATELGVAPSSQTKGLYKTLLNPLR